MRIKNTSYQIQKPDITKIKRRKKVISLLIGLLILSGTIFLGYRISNSRSFQFFGEIIHKVDTQEKVVALTFDDGPTGRTDEIIKLLEELDVKATFFVTGRELEENKQEGRNLVLAGHELGNHSYLHKRMVLKSPSFIKTEIESTDYLIREAGYQGDIHFRPPNAKKLAVLPYYLMRNEIKTIMWDVEPESYPEIAACSEEIINHVINNVNPGSIILLHVMYESRRESLNSIKGIVNALKAEGYTFKRVSELLEYQI